MPVTNYRLRKISAERKDIKVKSIEVNANSGIESMEKSKDPSIGEYVNVHFKYEVEYKPDIGNLLMEGNLWYYHDKFKTLVKENKDGITLKREAVREISTAIIRECLIEALDISRRLGLPAPMKLPEVEVKPEEVSFKKAS